MPGPMRERRNHAVCRRRHRRVRSAPCPKLAILFLATPRTVFCAVAGPRRWILERVEAYQRRVSFIPHVGVFIRYCLGLLKELACLVPRFGEGSGAGKI